MTPTKAQHDAAYRSQHSKRQARGDLHRWTALCVELPDGRVERERAPKWFGRAVADARAAQGGRKATASHSTVTALLLRPTARRRREVGGRTVITRSEDDSGGGEPEPASGLLLVEWRRWSL